MAKRAISQLKCNTKLGGQSRYSTWTWTEPAWRDFLDLNEMEELRNDAYINSNIAKQRLKRWHDQLISHKQFQKIQKVLLYDSKLHIFPGKLKSRWIGPFTIHELYSNGVVELLSSTGTFKVNGQCLKPFLEPFSKDKEEINLLKPHQAWKKNGEMDVFCRKTLSPYFLNFYLLFCFKFL